MPETRPWPVRVPLQIDPAHKSAHICQSGQAVCVAPDHLTQEIILHEAGHLTCRAKGGPGHLYPPGWRRSFHDVTGYDYQGIGTDMLAEGCAEAEKQRMEGALEGAPMKSFQSPTAMLQWQYREMLAELGELQRHAADPTCPCVQADTGEYCLMKHALGISYLARETASMVPEPDRDQLETLAEEALELHVALKDRVVCGKPHKDEADAVEWARQWRKKLEPRYYQACGTKKAREGAPAPAPVLKVSGKCGAGSHACQFAVKREGPKETTTLAGLADTLNAMSKEPVGGSALPQFQRIKVELGGRTYEFAPEAYRAMVRTVKATKQRELGFPLCQRRDGAIYPGELCQGNKCSIRMVTHCASDEPKAGSFHTHPGTTTQAMHLSAGDLENAARNRFLECEGGPAYDRITCAALKAGASQPRKGEGGAYAYIHPDAPADVLARVQSDRRIWRPHVGALFAYAEIPIQEVEGAATKVTKAQDQAPTVKITGKCGGPTCSFRVKAEDVKQVATASVKELGRAIDEARRMLTESRHQGSRQTFALGPHSLTRYEFRYEVVPAAQLKASHDPLTFTPTPGYPPELQPRLRDRAATQLQVAQMAAHLDPDALLTEFHSIDRGAPIVGPDMMVESGNGRVMALQRAVHEHPESYNRYRDELRVRASTFGMTAAAIDAVVNPVLVRVRETEVERRLFAQEANASTSIASSSVETARTDATLITLADLGNLDVREGQSIEDALRATNNAPFVKGFIGRLAPNDQARMIDSQGRLNQDGVRRLVLALFVAAFPGDSGLRLSEQFFESVEPTVRNAFHGLSLALGKLAQVEALTAGGQRQADLAIGDDLAKAITTLAAIKGTPGMTVEKYLAQGQLGTRQLTSFQEMLLAELGTRSRSGKAIGEMLAGYAQRVLDSPPPQQGGLLDLEPLSKPALLSSVVAREGEPLSHYMGVCNLSSRAEGRVWAWRPLRDFLLWASGVAHVEVCQAGMVPDSLQVTITRKTAFKPEVNLMVTERARHVPGMREVAVWGRPERVFTVVIPAMEVRAEDLIGRGQEVTSRDRFHPVAAEQTRLFAPKRQPWQMTREELIQDGIERAVIKNRSNSPPKPGIYYHVVSADYDGGDIVSFRERRARGEEIQSKWGDDAPGYGRTKDARRVSLFNSIAEAEELAGKGDIILEIRVPTTAKLTLNDELYAQVPRVPKEWIVGATSHRRVVAQALSEGKPVPPEVLKDYPDLASEGAPRRMVIPKEQLGLFGEIPAPVEHLEYQDKFKLFPFQAEGVRWLRKQQAALLADEMGLGKTPQAIHWAAEHRPVLVVVPAALALNWHREITAMWRPKDKVVVLGNEDWNPKELPDWTITTFNALPAWLPELRRAGFQSIVIDEAHNVKNLDAQRTINTLELVAPKKEQAGDRPIPYRLAVTGTPILNRPIELFPLLVFIGAKRRDELQQFLSTYTRWTLSHGRKVFKEARNLYQLNDSLKPLMLRRLKADVLKQLPPKTHTPLFVPITNAAEYQEAERNFLSWLADKKGNAAAIRASKAEIIARMNALRQLAAMGKVKPVADWLKPCDCEDGSGKVLVFSSFKEPLNKLAALKGPSVIYTGELSKEDRQGLVDDFQKDKCLCYFMGTVGAAGVGITLTAANRVAFLDLPWTPGGKLQAEDRAHRIGQKRPVEIVNVLAKGTIDERMLQLLNQKEQVIAQAVDGKTADEAATASVSAGLLDSYLSGQSFGAPVQYEVEGADESVDSLTEEQVRILQGEGAPVKPICTAPQARKLERCVRMPG